MNFTLEEKEKIVKLYKELGTQPKVAEYLGIDEDEVVRVLHEFNIDDREIVRAAKINFFTGKEKLISPIVKND